MNDKKFNVLRKIAGGLFTLSGLATFGLILVLWINYVENSWLLVFLAMFFISVGMILIFDLDKDKK